MLMDEKNKHIVDLLRQNARISNTKIAKQVELTEGAVRHRVNALVKGGTIKKFTIETSSESEVFAVVMIKSKGSTKRCMHDIAMLKLAKESYEISGDFDGCVIIESNNLEELDNDIDQIRKLKSVADTKTFISLKKW